MSLTYGQLSFNYRLQVWVRNGIVQPCAHPDSMRLDGPCCAQSQHAGQSILALEGGAPRARRDGMSGPAARGE